MTRNYFIGLLLCTLLPTIALANKSSDISLGTPSVSELSLEQADQINQKNVISSLESAITWLDKNTKKLKKNKQEIKKTHSEVERKSLEKQEKSLQENIEKNKKNFVQLATGGVISQLENQDYIEPTINWQDELTDVLKPLISEIKNLTFKQRTKEQLRAELAFYDEQKGNLLAAKERVSKLIEAANDNTLVKNKLNELSTTIEDRLTETNSYVEILSVKQQELTVLEQKDSGWKVKIKSIFSGIFFHFFLSLCAGIITYYLVKLCVDFLDRINPRNNRKLLFATRAFQFVLRMLAILLALSVYSVMLIALGEWALMTVSMIFIFGAIFSLKDILPKYFAEMRTILNMGSIREGDRVMYKNVPWLVKNLDFYTEIYNRDLASTLRLPIAEVADLRSRSSDKSELWFPTRRGDYVLLDDGVYGEVIRQSPDNVLIEHYGSLISYQTTDFLAAKPRNLSRKHFCVTSTIGVDYKHQPHVNRNMLKQLNAFYNKALLKTEFAEHVVSLEVEFSLANTSSLDYLVILTSKGNGAAYYTKMKRWLQQVGLDCCNEFNWEIPFQQMVMHQAKQGE
ncbi:MAG: hypothetical protein AAGF06_01355 [Pseudomonadota bacterium]